MRADPLVKPRRAPSGSVDAAEAFRQTYESLNERVYRGTLPAWPGARLTDTFDVITAVNAWRGRRDEVRGLGPFTVSLHVRDAGILGEAFRHETAHVAAMVLDAHWDHGLPWQEHARACGASPRATFDGSPWTRGGPTGGLTAPSRSRP
jgi:hypothetical protein